VWKELVAELDGKKLTMVDFDRDTEDGDAYARSQGFVGQPAIVIYGTDGQIAHKQHGPSTAKETEALIRKWADGA